MGKILGIDQGIASIGYGIIDSESYKIIDAGVRLFPEADKKNNEGRRSFRSSRRLKRRRVNRRDDLRKLLVENNLFSTYENLNPYECRLKGLTQKLTKEELNCALFNLSKHRGSSLETVEEENKANEESTKYQLAENDKLLIEGKFVCEIQMERLSKIGKIRGNFNNFRSSAYEKELRQILKTQNINDDLIKEIVDCVMRRRNYSEGPGSFISQTPYGQLYDENGKVIVNMIEKMTGHCSVYPNELRAPKLAPSAEFFNLLNDLNNLRIDDELIDVSTKQELIKQAFETCSLKPSKIAKALGSKIDEISGFRVDKKDKPITTDLEGFKILKGVFESNGMSIGCDDIKILDEVAVILTKTKVLSERIDELKKLLGDNLSLINELSNQTKFTGYHSLSLKAIYDINEELYNSQYNQMQILHLSNKFEFRNEKGSQKGKKKIQINDEAILSPVALRSYKQAIKVINAARSKYGEFDAIVVETTRAKNSDEEKRMIKNTQAFFENRNKKAQELLKNYPDVKLTAKLREKLVLYEEQQGKTSYEQIPIDLHLLITNPEAYEVDHIIPISISLDDSINNKTLCTHSENQEKDNLTPLMAFANGKFSSNVENYKAFVTSLNYGDSNRKKKLSNYLYAKDITKYENMKDFIARNLVDTSYANRLLFNTLSDYFRDNEIKTAVHTVKGSATNRFRKYLKLEKDRDKDYSHHAIDALLIASIKKIKLYDNLLKDFKITGNDKEIIYNKNTGEIIEKPEDLDMTGSYIQFIKDISNYKVEKFSWMVDTKPNRSIADQTIYSTREVNGDHFVVKKYKDIYANKMGTKFCPIADDIMNGNIDRYLMHKNDPLTWSIMEDIVRKYYDQFKEDKDKISINKKGEIEFKFNPFNEMLNENPNARVKKFSKHGNGPVITSIKYLDGKLNSCVDITNNYKTRNKKIVLLQVSPYRTDFYNDNGIYKFVTIRYSNVKYEKSKNLYCINRDWYKNELIRKKISEKAEFMFSMHHNEILYLKDNSRNSYFRFIATKYDDGNVIEIKKMDMNNSERITPTIGKSIEKIKKYSCDSLGQLREVKESCLKLEFK